MSDIITLREGEEIIGDHRLSGLRIIVTTQRLLLLNKHRLSIPLERIRSYRVEHDKVGLVALAIGVFLIILAFLVPSVSIYTYDTLNGTYTCVQYGILNSCPHPESAGAVGFWTLPLFLLIGALIAYWGYKHLERLEIVTSDGAIHIIRGRSLKDVEISLYKATTMKAA